MQNPGPGTAQAYPLIFKFTNDILIEDKFSARVITHGRALMVIEDGAWWCHGVEPGGMTATGEDPGVAFSAFRKAFQEILEDIAADATDCHAFAKEAGEFVLGACRAEAERWELARAIYRSGQDVPAPFDKLRRETGEFSASLVVADVVELDTPAMDVSLAEKKAA